MHDVVFASGWDTALIMVPFIGMTALAMFGLDEKLASPKRPRKTRRSFCQFDPRDTSRLLDPDVLDPDGKHADRKDRN